MHDIDLSHLHTFQTHSTPRLYSLLAADDLVAAADYSDDMTSCDSLTRHGMTSRHVDIPYTRGADLAACSPAVL